MRRPKISLKTIFIIVTIAAVTFAEIATYSTVLARVFVMCVSLFITSAPVGVYYRRGEERAFWLGVTISGTAYYFAWDHVQWDYFSMSVMNLFLTFWWWAVYALVGGLIARYLIYCDADTEISE